MTDHLADDSKTILERMREIAEERKMAQDVESAKGDWLDMHGARVDLPRNAGESDYAYRGRIKSAMEKT